MATLQQKSSPSRVRCQVASFGEASFGSATKWPASARHLSVPLPSGQLRRGMFRFRYQVARISAMHHGNSSKTSLQKGHSATELKTQRTIVTTS